MAKFISIPGMAPTGGEGNQGSSGSGSGGQREIADTIHEWYGEQAYANPRAAEYLKARGETSHTSIAGAGTEFHYKEKGVGGEVLHEEVNAHTGNVEQTVRVSDATGSGTRRLTWAPSGPRTMVMTDDKKVTD